LNLFVEAVPDRPWPLHPRPSEWEDLETWVRQIAEAYGVSYDAFLLNALGHKGSGARDLDHAPIQVLARLSAGTGIPINRLREMSTQRVMRCMGQWPRGKRRTSAGSGSARLPLRHGVTPTATHVGEPRILVTDTQHSPSSCCHETPENMRQPPSTQSGCPKLRHLRSSVFG
jgi:hypothetical protein